MAITSGHPSATGRAQDRESSPAKDRRSTNATKPAVFDSSKLTPEIHRLLLSTIKARDVGNGWKAMKEVSSWASCEKTENIIGHDGGTKGQQTPLTRIYYTSREVGSLNWTQEHKSVWYGPHRRLRATPPGQRAIGPCRSRTTGQPKGERANSDRRPLRRPASVDRGDFLEIGHFAPFSKFIHIKGRNFPAFRLKTDTYSFFCASWPWLLTFRPQNKWVFSTHRGTFACQDWRS